MHSSPLARSAQLGTPNAQNQNTGDASQQLPPTHIGLHASVNLSLPVPNGETTNTPTNSGRRLPSIPNNAGIPLVLPSSNQTNQPNQPILNNSNSGNTPPQRPNNRAYEQLPNSSNTPNIVVSALPRGPINNSYQQLSNSSNTPNIVVSALPRGPINNSYEQLSNSSSNPNVVVSNAPHRPSNNSYEQLSESPSKRSSSSRTPNVTNDNGSVSSDDKSSRSSSFGMSVKSLIPSKKSKLRKSTSDISNSSDSISEKGSQPRTTQQGSAAFKDVYPCLAQHEDLQNFTSVEQVENHFITLPESVSVLSSFQHIQDVQYLYSRTGIDQPDWQQIDEALDIGIQNLDSSLKKIDKLKPNDEKTKELLACLGKELSRQLVFLRDKKIENHYARNSDPFSEKGIKNYGVLCSSLIEELFNAALADVIKVKKEKYEKKIQKTASDDLNTYDEFDQFDSTFIEKLFDKYRPAIKKFQEKKKQEREQARSDIRFDILEGETPAKAGERLVKKEKKEALEFLMKILEKIGFQDFETKKFIQGKETRNAMRQALNNQEPKNEKRRIVTSLNGVVGRFDIEAIYDDNWKSSADKCADGFPRNCKIHRIYMIKDDGERILLRNFIGHGVLDAWAEKNGDKRIEANKNSGVKVVQKAIESNPRVIEISNDGYTPKIVHVSLLLVTPTPLPDIILPLELLPDVREKAYLLGQFKAFEDVIQESKEKNLFKVNGTLPDVEICAFGFGTNDLATGEHKSKITGGWGYVKDQNDKSMQSFFGKNFDIHQQGKIPGGLIGEVIKEIKGSKRLDAEQIQSYLFDLITQTDSILKMYSKEDYKYSDDDPIKMNRELEELISTANEALAAIHSNCVITLSKGCKSDKDRGGMTAAEILFNAIRKALGLPRLIYNQPLSEEEEDLYVAIAALFFDNQELNTGLRGNKADGRKLPLKKQAYVDGLEKSAKG
jgi:hypothetical protein